MNAISAQIIPFPTTGHGGMRHQALVLGNTARRTTVIMDNLVEACGSLRDLAEDGERLSGAALQLHAELEDVMAQINHCTRLMREMGDP